MSETVFAFVFVAALFLLLGGGVWVGIALFGVAAIGMELFTSRPTGGAMVTTVWGGSASWTLTALPMFIWMGEILFRSRLSQDMFRGLAPWMRHLPGRLMHVNVVGCTIFAAMSGSSAATVATIGRISAPELRARGYDERMIVGTLAGAGTLGLLIPPSIILIVYGVAAQASIAQLFMAGVVPGLLLAALFMGYIAVWSLLNPDRVPPADAPESLWAKIAAARHLLPALGLIVVVLGSIYGGIATATEAAAFGVLGALLLSWLQGSLDWATFRDSLMGAVRTNAMIALILAGSTFLTLAVGYTGLPRLLAQRIDAWGLSPTALLLALVVFYVALGFFLDGISTVVLTAAVVLPMIQAAGIDLIWFGVFVVILVETAQITPPVGFNLFVLQGLTERDIGYVARAATPYFLLMLALVGIIIAFPEIVTWLPRRMATG